jgi:hypothetical protein
MRQPVVMASLGRVYGRTGAEGVLTFLVRLYSRLCPEGCLTSCTVTFQESILTILPAAIFLALTGPRAVYLFRSKDQTRKKATYTPKLVLKSC